MICPALNSLNFGQKLVEFKYQTPKILQFQAFNLSSIVNWTLEEWVPVVLTIQIL